MRCAAFAARPRRVHFPASIFPVLVLSIVTVPKCYSSFCGKVFAFTPALRSGRSCGIGTASRPPKLRGELESRLAFNWRSGDAEFFHPAAQRVGMEGEDLRRAVGTI